MMIRLSRLKGCWAIVVLLLMACQSDSESVDGKATEFVRFAASSIIGAEGSNETTIGAFMLADNGTKVFGTYCNRKTYDWLVPCQVGADGAWIQDDNSCGLILSGGSPNYNLSFSTPAIAPVNYSGQSYGYYQSRIPENTSEAEKFSDVIRTQVSGNILNGQYIYQIPDGYQLCEHRAKFQFVFKCGDDMSSALFKKVSLSHVMDDAYYDVQSKDFRAPSSFSDLVIWSGDMELTTGKTQNVGDVCYLLSQNYSKQDENGAYLYEYPVIHLELGTTTFDEPLNFDVQPQYFYTIQFTVNSVYVTMDVTARQWSDGGVLSHQIGEYDTMTFLLTPRGWTANDNSVTIQS